MDSVTVTESDAGFVEDVRRMNVGITRASRALWLLGNAQTLSVNVHWRALFDDARSRGCVISEASASALFPEAKLWLGSHRRPLSAAESEGAALREEAEATRPVGGGTGRAAHLGVPACHLLALTPNKQS
jgi:hypothetical protein